MTREEEIKKITEFQYEYIGSTDEKKAFRQGVLTGAEWADKNPNGSLIKWQTGEPKESGEYIVSLKDGTVCRDEWRELYCEDEIKCWVYNDDDVVAWCKLSSIKPYKEEQ